MLELIISSSKSKRFGLKIFTINAKPKRKSYPKMRKGIESDFY